MVSQEITIIMFGDPGRYEVRVSPLLISNPELRTGDGHASSVSNRKAIKGMRKGLLLF
jgi:hypothetical protein